MLADRLPAFPWRSRLRSKPTMRKVASPMPFVGKTFLYHFSLSYDFSFILYRKQMKKRRDLSSTDAGV